MGTISTATYNAGTTPGQLQNGANTFDFTGSFSGSQANSDVVLTASPGTIDGSQTQITSQSTTAISGTFSYTRTGFGTDESGTITASVNGPSLPVQIAIPPIDPE